MLGEQIYEKISLYIVEGMFADSEKCTVITLRFAARFFQLYPLKEHLETIIYWQKVPEGSGATMEVSLEFISWHKCLFELMPLITFASNMPRLKSFMGQVALPRVINFYYYSFINNFK